MNEHRASSSKLPRRFLFPILGLALACLLVGEIRSVASGSGTAQPGRDGSSRPPAISRITAEGRLVAEPNAEVSIASELGGTIESIPVHENDRVRKGQLLVLLRADDHRAALAEAKARSAEVEADIRLAELEVERSRRLLVDQVTSRQDFERRQRDLDAARARADTAAASLRRLEAILAKARLVSPIDGVVVARHQNPGETIDRGVSILTVADLGRTRIEAEVDEFDTARITLGATATIRAEGYGPTGWSGTVTEIPLTVVGRRLKPQDPGRPTDTRVLLVKIALTKSTPLKLGQRVDVEIAGAN